MNTVCVDVWQIPFRRRLWHNEKLLYEFQETQQRAFNAFLGYALQQNTYKFMCCAFKNS